MKVNQLKVGVILSYMTQAVHILKGLVYTPVMLRLLGQSEYGLYNLVSSVVSYLGLLSFGFGAGYMRFYSRYKSKNDTEGVAKINGMFLVIFSVISLLCLIVGTFLIFNIKSVFGDGLTSYELKKSKVLMIFMVVNLALNLLGTVFGNYITAHEKFVFQKTVNFLTSLLNPFITLPLLLVGVGSLGMVLVSSFLTVAGLLVNLYYCFKKLHMQFSFNTFDFSLLKEMWVFTFFVFINIIVDQINWSVDKFLLGRMMGTTAVAVYSVAANLNSMYMTFSTTVSSVFVPKVNMMVSNNDNHTLNKLFIKVGRVQIIIIGLIISGYIMFGKEFIALWAGSKYIEAYYVGLFLMIPLTIPLIQNLGIEVQRAKNKHQVRSVVYLLVAISNIFVSMVCIKIWGIVGASVGTAVSLLLGNGLVMNIYYHKKLDLNILAFWKEILKIVLPIVVTMLVALVIKKVIVVSGIYSLIFNIIIYCIIYLCFIYFMGANSEEKKLIIVPLEKLGEKICKK